MPLSNRSLRRGWLGLLFFAGLMTSPAQVRITDQFGNVHYAMIEPFADADEISQGAEVVVLRLRGA